MTLPLRAAFGRYAHTAPLLDGERRSPLLDLRFEPVAPISRAFAPMVRQGRFDASEMAIATFLMAKAAGKPLVLLPVALAARFQEGALLCRADGPVRGPADLAGRRIGVRAYSQTTGMWLRGVLAESFGLRPEAMRWVTFEDAHLAEYRDPPFCERAPAGAELAAMLRRGETDAAIFGNELPEDPAFRPVFPDPEAAGEAFRARYGCMPVNHLAVVRQEIAERHPEAVAELVRLLASPALPHGRAALWPAIALASRWCAEQGLTPRVLPPEEVWAGLPAGVG
ncbi:MAG: ABC transporter substrate-binding protein [Acetobacteraceae bacterium]|nr:ABC transporter substrate-binding protein [Acetobacteraceae bacterium]MDW8399120.1 ABC transporter substrate-binding protein [Acetobacteraceae bacterium]